MFHQKHSKAFYSTIVIAVHSSDFFRCFCPFQQSHGLSSLSLRYYKHRVPKVQGLGLTRRTSCPNSGPEHSAAPRSKDRPKDKLDLALDCATQHPGFLAGVITCIWQLHEVFAIVEHCWCETLSKSFSQSLHPCIAVTVVWIYKRLAMFILFAFVLLHRLRWTLPHVQWQCERCRHKQIGGIL